MLRTQQRWAFVLILIIGVLAAACQPAATPTPTPRPTATTAPPPTEPSAATSEATTEIGAATSEATTEVIEEATTEATTEIIGEATSEATTEMIGAATSEATTEMTEMAPTEEMTSEATLEETLQVVIPSAPTEEMTAEATMEATSEVTMEASAETRNIIEVARADGNFKTLLAALDKAGLTETLEGAGSFTVFAPTDAAFAKMLADGNMTEDDLLNNPDLANILRYHVVSATISPDKIEDYRSADNPDEIIVPTMDGDKTLSITFDADGKLVVNNTANVILQNLPASNGVLYVIDGVLTPPSGEATPEATMMEATEEATTEVVAMPTLAPTEEVTLELMPTADVLAPTEEATMESTAEMTVETRNIIEVAQADGNFKTLLAALDKAGWTDELEGEGPFTVFAPTDEAFEKLLSELNMTEADLLDRDDLADILKYHVVEGAFTTSDLQTMTSEEVNNTFVIPTLDDDKVITIKFADDGTAMINDTVKVTVANIEASNGIIHVIDTVLMPPSGDATDEPTAEATVSS